MAFVLMKKSHKESVEKVSLLSKDNKINGGFYTANIALGKKKPKPKNTTENNINASLTLSV